MAAAICSLVFSSPRGLAQDPDPQANALEDVTQGSLRAVGADGSIVECPLRHTDVRAEISGMVARVKVTQTFVNPFDKVIEAIYVFPLSHTGAVDSMTMVVGGRRIVGVLKKREEARADYEKAIAEGKTAALLEQDRPNIFVQAVGNIPVGGEVRVEISCIDVLKYDAGEYEFHFPMVVGPRFTPLSSGPVSAPAQPGILPPGHRNGHDISLSLALDAGVPIRDVKCVSHETSAKWNGNSRVEIAISPADSIPNKDFVLRYRVMGPKPASAVLANCGPDGDGTFLIMMVPGEKAGVTAQAPPRDLCFLVDVSGSMSGKPIAKVIESMRLFLGRMRPCDSFQVVTFAGQAQKLFGEYAGASADTVAAAEAFVTRMQAGGGTRMLEGVKVALESPDPERVRVVVMLTDGYIGNEAEIIGLAGTNCGPHLKFWVLGIGSSPNRFLVDGVAEATGGLGLTLGIDEDAKPVTEKIMSRLARSQIGDIEMSFSGIESFEIQPRYVPELFADTPVVITGKYRGSAAGKVRVTGTGEGGEKVDFELAIDGSAAAHPSLPVIWARNKIKLLKTDLTKFQHMGDAASADEFIKAITALALEFGIMCEYTAFVAVEEQVIVNPDGKPEKKTVPVPIPEGTKFGGFFGAGDAFQGKYWNSAIGIGGGSGGSFGARFGGRRNLRAYGGGRHTESAVLLGLIWLKNHQSSDGGWSTAFDAICKSEPHCTGRGTAPELEQTALAALAFLGAGHTHTTGKFKETMKGCLKKLLTAQRADGAFAAEGADADARTQAVCALTLAEAYGMSSKSPILATPAQKAVDFLVSMAVQGSGWPAGKGGKPDTLTTAWAVMALKAAMLSGLSLPEKPFDGAIAWLDSVTGDDGTVGFHSKDDRGSEGAGSTANPLTSTAAAIFARIMAAGPEASKDAKLLAGAELVKNAPPKWDAKVNDMDFEFWYFGTLAMFQMGRDHWKSWNEPLTNALLPTMHREGCLNGSWDPLGPRAQRLGRVETTALNTLSLEVYYRYGKILNSK